MLIVLCIFFTQSITKESFIKKIISNHPVIIRISIFVISSKKYLAIRSKFFSENLDSRVLTTINIFAFGKYFSTSYGPMVSRAVIPLKNKIELSTYSSLLFKLR